MEVVKEAKVNNKQLQLLNLKDKAKAVEIDLTEIVVGIDLIEIVVGIDLTKDVEAIQVRVGKKHQQQLLMKNKK